MENGDVLATGQVLFHGGDIVSHLNINESIVTERPFSSSFCPAMALRNSNWRGKSYDKNQVNLLILRVVDSNTNAFVFKINGTDKGHEKEVLFASNATLTLRKRTILAKNYTTYKADEYFNAYKKSVPAYLLHVDIS
ncbi:hypothetical protein L7G72_14170 [Xenorhabdus bovienii]|uniref:hypothetical protein n=1 Tax=Xenorhabdus bovienii TaxID=40576 RepID=UPI001EE0093A|nr:hypothetical protein [Xenorhabdus bovienii]MCG3462972.1 hypothetical protein [Xenorhabdus bovienii]